MNPSPHRHLLAGTSKGLFAYVREGQSDGWHLSAEAPLLAGWEVFSLCSIARRDGGFRWLAGVSSFIYGPAIYLSDDAGATWRAAERSPRYPEGGKWSVVEVWQIVPAHPSEPETLYAGVAKAGLFISRDLGETWDEVESLTDHPTRSRWFPGKGGLCLHTILTDPNNPARMWLGISAVGVFRTDDGGATWNVRTTGIPAVVTDGEYSEIGRCVHKMVQDPRDPSYTFYMQFHGGVFRSVNGAETWESIENGLPSNFGFPMVTLPGGELFVMPLHSDGLRVMPEGQLRVFRSRDRGDSWESASAGLPTAEYVGVLRDAMTAFGDHSLCFGTTMGELYASSDRGDNWQRLPGQLPRINCVRVLDAA